MRVQTKAKNLLVTLTLLIICCFALALLVPGCCPFTKYTWYNWQMSRYVSDFDSLNSETLLQLPVYPYAQLVRLSNSGADTNDFLISKPRHLNAFYISDDSPSEIYEFLRSEMLAQGWQGERHGFTALYRKGQTCVGIIVSPWGIDAKSVTGYTPSPFEKAPTSWYWLYIEHTIESVPGAPEPPDWSLFECPPEDGSH